MANVLVVDDQPDLCNVLVRVLRHLGHEADCRYDGPSALERVQAEPRPDVVILDVMMPGMDGMEVLKRVKGDPATTDTRVVMYSALTDPQYRDRSLRLGARDYWVKAQVDFAALEERLTQVLA